MAVVALTMTVFDSQDNESTITLYSSDTFTIVTLRNAVIALVPIVGALIKGGIRPKANITIAVDLTDDLGAYYQPVDEFADVEEGLFYQFNTASASSIREGRIPTINEEVFIAGTKEVDPANTDWLAFETAMLTGLAGVSTGSGTTTVTFNDKHGNDLVSTRDAYEQFLGSRAR